MLPRKGNWVSDQRYVTVALEIFDLHNDLGHKMDFRDCQVLYCRAAGDTVTEEAWNLLRKTRARTYPLESGPECEETDFDAWGDHDGPVHRYRVTSFILGKRPDEAIRLCRAHRYLHQAETTVLAKDES